MPVLALLAQMAPPTNFPSDGPDDLKRLLGMFFALIGIGFGLGLVGHLVRSRTLVAMGFGAVIVGTGFFVVAMFTHG